MKEIGIIGKKIKNRYRKTVCKVLAAEGGHALGAIGELYGTTQKRSVRS